MCYLTPPYLHLSFAYNHNGLNNSKSHFTASTVTYCVAPSIQHGLLALPNYVDAHCVVVKREGGVRYLYSD